MEVVPGANDGITQSKGDVLCIGEVISGEKTQPEEQKVTVQDVHNVVSIQKDHIPDDNEGDEGVDDQEGELDVAMMADHEYDSAQEALAAADDLAIAAASFSNGGLSSLGGVGVATDEEASSMNLKRVAAALDAPPGMFLCFW